MSGSAQRFWNRFGAVAFLCLVLAAGQAWSMGLELVPAEEPQTFFGDSTGAVRSCWRNAGRESVEVDFGWRLLQASSSTAMPVRSEFWKRLRLLPGQTVLESATMGFPAVRGETRFVIQWVRKQTNVAGMSEVLVYPTNLLAELNALGGGLPVGVLDPEERLKPLLQAQGVGFVDLAPANWKDLPLRLAILGPFESARQMRESLAGWNVAKLAERGAGVVWILPPNDRLQGLRPSFYSVAQGARAVVVAQAELIADLSQSPLAQINLVQLARQAVSPPPIRLPSLEPEP